MEPTATMLATAAMTDGETGPAMLAQEAMGTVFTVTASHVDPAYAQQALRAALEELAWLEDRLSRFRPASDIGQLNRLPPGQSLAVAPETLACLQTALEMEEATGGAFDIGYASPPSPGPRIALDSTTSSVRVLTPVRTTRFGGDWQGLRARPNGGDSGRVGPRRDHALGQHEHRPGKGKVAARARPVGLDRAGIARRPVLLNDAVMSASGTSVQGFHIIDPRTRRPATHRTRCWAKAPTAAEADALSTAFMVMDDAEIAAYCRRHPDVSAYL